MGQAPHHDVVGGPRTDALEPRASAARVARGRHRDRGRRRRRRPPSRADAVCRAGCRRHRERVVGRVGDGGRPSGTRASARDRRAAAARRPRRPASPPPSGRPPRRSAGRRRRARSSRTGRRCPAPGARPDRDQRRHQRFGRERGVDRFGVGVEIEQAADPLHGGVEVGPRVGRRTSAATWSSAARSVTRAVAAGEAQRPSIA